MNSCLRIIGRGGMAQLVERLLCTQDVSGSSPLTSTHSIKQRLALAAAQIKKYIKSFVKPQVDVIE